MRGLHWFRTDLRITDNTALKNAIANSQVLITLFIITIKTWEEHNDASIKIQFIYNNLNLLSKELEKNNIPLLIYKTDYFSNCKDILTQVCNTFQIEHIYFNKQYELDELKRDEKIINFFTSQSINVHTYDDQIIMPPGSILSQQGTPLKVFTPFKKKWLDCVFSSNAWEPKSVKKKKFELIVKPSHIALQEITNWPAGEKIAKQKLDYFCQHKLLRYHHDRDYPILDDTSKLSPYLTLGILSPRQCIQAIIKQLNLSKINLIQSHLGAATWLSELIWREFYKHIVFYFPDVCRYKAFKPETEKIHWNNNEIQFDAWCNGKTGFPFVDAAMRQLNQTGWMHNRLRMVVAMFLAKILLIDWRWGEKYFMSKLIDGDLAANNGGWQWCASTGTDAVPYFRIFNPITQSQRFDPRGEFIRKFCPELSKLDDKSIHDPYQFHSSTGLNYPKPIVDYKKCREITLQAFKKISLT